MSASIPVPDVEELAHRLGMDKSKIADFKAGKVVTQERDASNDKDLALLVALTVPASLEKTCNFAKEQRVIEIQEANLAQGNINLETFELEGFTFDHGTKDHITSFHMSKAEAKKVKSASNKQAEFLQVLSARAKAYWEKGLKGVEPYDGKNHDIAHDLQCANKATLELSRDPVISKEIEMVPSKSTHPEWHSMRWNITQGNSMTSITLTHAIFIEKAGGFLSIQNKFYSATDFDSSQIIVGVIPTAEHQSAVFYMNHTYTASVAGFGGGTKRSIGRKMMKGTLVETMEKAKKALAN